EAGQREAVEERGHRGSRVGAGADTTGPQRAVRVPLGYCRAMDPVAHGPDLLRTPSRLVNPATVGGAVAVGVGLVLVLVPAVSLGLTETVIALGLLVSGTNDLWDVVRRRRARATARAAAVLRGSASLVLAGVF